MFPLPNLIRKRDDLVLGRVGPSRLSAKFRIGRSVRKYHSYITGITGRGKSYFLRNLIVQDIKAGRGCAVVDPHGDLAKDVLRSLITSGYFATPHSFEKIVYVAPRRRDYIIPFNVLARPDTYSETYEIAQRVISAFQRTWAKALAEPPRFQQIMRSSLATLIETEETLCNLYRLLVDNEYRRDRLAHISNPKVAADCRNFFENEYDRWGKDRLMMISSTTNKVSALTDNPSMYFMLGQKENNINIRRIMDEGKTLLIDLGDCDDETKRLFGTLVVTGFEHAALSRSHIAFKDRRPYYLYIDEFQDFACHPGAAETFSQMLSQVRKFGLHMILANQSIAQLSDQLQTALGNAQTIVAFRISRADAEALAKVLGNVDTQAVKHESQTETQHPVYAPLFEQWEDFIISLTTLQVRQAFCKTADDRLSVIWSEKVNDNTCSLEALEEVITESLKIHGLPYQEVYQQLVAHSRAMSPKPADYWTS